MPRQTFRLYDATIAPRSDDGPVRRSAVPKTGMTAPEIAILIGLHGPECVKEATLVSDGEVQMDTFELRNLLAEKYRTANTDGRKILDAMYGAAGSLPETIAEAVGGFSEPLSREDRALLQGMHEEDGGPVRVDRRKEKPAKPLFDPNGE